MDISVKEVPEQAAAVIRRTIQMSQIPETIDECIPAVAAAIEVSGQKPVGPAFVRYPKMDGDTVEIEVGFPVETPFTAWNGVEGVMLSGGEMAHSDFFGDYSGLYQAHVDHHQWIADQGRAASESTREIYWTDPRENPDPATWRTELLTPMAPKTAS